MLVWDENGSFSFFKNTLKLKVSKISLNFKKCFKSTPEFLKIWS